MGRTQHSLLIIVWILINPLCKSQTPVKVSDPRLEMNGNIITISYDILNSSPEEKYNVSIEIKDENGNVINAKALNGDIGDEVTGGNNKQISWNLEADNLYIDVHIYVQLNVKIISPSPDSRSNSQSYNRTGLIIQSIAFPGLGLSRVSGDPHWIRGVAGYGCIIGSLVLNRQAINSYNGIEDLVYFDDVNEAYDKSIRQNNISNILAFTAIGIWATDIIWTVVGTSSLKKNPYSTKSTGFSFGSSIDPITYTPMISIRYNFRAL